MERRDFPGPVPMRNAVTWSTAKHAPGAQCVIGEPMITRRHLLSAAGGLVAFSATPVVAAEAEPKIGFMEIKRNGSQSSGKGSADYFTGTVRIDPLFQASEPARGTGASVTFEPGARTAWHTHPLGQTLIVTAGVGRVQRWAVRSRKSGRAMWSGFRLARSIGTALRPRRQ